MSNVYQAQNDFFLFPPIPNCLYFAYEKAFHERILLILLFRHLLIKGRKDMELGKLLVEIITLETFLKLF